MRITEAWGQATFKRFEKVLGQSAIGALLVSPVCDSPRSHGFCLLGNYCVTWVGEPDFTRRLVVSYVAHMYFCQLTWMPYGTLDAGFINWAETAVFGSPSLTCRIVLSLGAPPP